MKKLVVAVLLLLLFAMVGGAAWVAMSGTTERPPAEAAPPTVEEAPAPDEVHRDRVRVGTESAPVPEPAVPTPSTGDVEEIPESASPGELIVHDGRIDGPAIGQEVAFLDFDHAAPPAWFHQMETSDPVELAFEHGRILRTGSDGRVRLPAFEGFAVVAARTVGSRGMAWIPRDEGPEWTLVMAVSKTVWARVEDATGKPVGGVRVAVRLRQGDETWPLAFETSEPNGLVEIEFADEGLEGAYEVAALIPSRDQPSAVFDADDVPEDPIDLILPAGGTLVVHLVDASGSVCLDRLDVSVQSPRGATAEYFDAPENDPSATKATAVGGVARIEHVGLGLTLDVTVASGAGTRTSVTASVAGPTALGEEATCQITVGGGRPVIVGRLAYDDGTPVAGLDVRAQVLVPGRNDDRWSDDLACTTDDDGGFRFTLDVLPGADEKAALQIGRQATRSTGGYSWELIVTKPLTGLRSEVPNDVGTIELERPQTLVSGRVLGPDGSPLAAHVAVMSRTQWGQAPTDGIDAASTDPATGAFQIQGTADSETVQLGVLAAGYYLAEAVTVARGATDVVLRMTQAGGVGGSVRMPDGMEPWSVRVIVTGDVTANNDTEHRWGPKGSVDGTPGDDGTFEIDTLRPGTATVALRIGWNEDDTVLVVEDVPIVAGRVTRDPRLEDVDIAALLGGIAITVVGGDGKPISEAQVHAKKTDSSDGWTYWQEFQCDDDGVATVRLKSDALDLVATAPGHRSAALLGVDTDRTVRLEKGKSTEVTVRLSTATPLPDPPRELRAQLSWAGELGGAATPADWSDDPRDANSSHMDDSTFGADRSVAVPVTDPGRYRVTLWLWEVEMSGASGSPIDTSPAEVIVTVPGDGSPVSVEVAGDADALRRRTDD